MFKNVLALFALLLIAVCPVFAGHHSQTVVFHDGNGFQLHHTTFSTVSFASAPACNGYNGFNGAAFQGAAADPCQNQQGFNGVSYGEVGNGFERGGIRIIRRPRPTIIIR